ncbi:hypothetical protein [Amycolatopsis keratiniphila]|uniref:hypothetical protein n=1 Tax=Amycolatopsis keratiniphila TaxID=129921 RepID=UPI00087AA968|nr:hypothetical protein [Amycolatopsis keratiniphila]OLZ55966.1 hypothetical protein BS330_17655 [Amycolatopsis keratiniphila subsp. nogabecina]SDU50783.1 hypothetical protein SAMN04489733_5195 [Amycolatopsis keratiniphila]
MSQPTQAQINEMLNDPYVTQGTKDALMLPWNREEAYKKAVAERDANAAGDKKQAAETKQADKDLDAMSRPAAGGSTTKSDQVLDLGKPALDFFSDWAEQVWNKMPEKSGEISYKTDIWDRFHENREINFQKMFDEVEDLADAKKIVEQTQKDASSALTTLFHDWKGEGATAAKVKYEQRIQPDAKELIAQMDGAIKLVPSTIDKIYSALKLKVDETLKLRVDKVATAPLYIAKQVVDIANGKVDSKEKLMDVAYWLDSACPGNNLAERLRHDDCKLNDENKDYAIGAAKQWLKGSFATEFGERYENFKKLCKNATETINTQYHELSRFMEDYTNPFPAPGSEKPPADDGKGKDKGGGGDTGGGTGGGSGTGSGGGSGSGGGASTPPAATVPETPKPEEKPAEGTNPVTGKPLEIDPETGKPYPIDPSTGEAIKDGIDGQDTMTVQKGDNKIEMTEPDKDGKMDIKVDDGKGNEKDYKLDFDDPKGEDGKPGEEGKDLKEGEFGPKGTVKEGEPGPDGVYRPGPDGKIHIQDGNLKITAEQPDGPNGPTVVTVDDGKGEPTTYTLDEKGEEKELKPGEDLKNGLDDRNPGNPQPGKTDDIRTMPAPAEGGMAPAGGGGSGFSAPGGVEVGVGAEGTAGVSAGAEAAGGGGASGVGADGTAPAASGGGGGGSFEGALGSPIEGASSGALNEAGSLEAGMQSGGGAQPAGAEGGLGMAPGGMDPAPAGAGSSPAGMGGMMGGMGAMGGAAGGGGGDTQRGSSQYRVEGGIFETSGAGGRISGSLDDEGGDRSISYER